MKEKNNLLEKNNVGNDGEKRKSPPPISLTAMTFLLYFSKITSGAQNFAILPYMVGYDPFKTGVVLGSYILGIVVGTNLSGINSQLHIYVNNITRTVSI